MSTPLTTITRGIQNIVWGLDPTIANNPNLFVCNCPAQPCKIRLRFRAKCLTKAYVKTKDGLTVYFLSRVNTDTVMLVCPTGQNRTLRSSLPSVKNPVPSA